jgi:hypothetical protein
MPFRKPSHLLGDERAPADELAERDAANRHRKRLTAGVAGLARSTGRNTASATTLSIVSSKTPTTDAAMNAVND